MKAIAATSVVVGPISVASPTRGLQALRARLAAAKRDGIPLPDGSPERDLEVFRGQIQAAKNAGIHAFMAPIVTVEHGVEVYENLVRLQDFCAALGDDVTLVTHIDAIAEAQASGRIGIIAQFQGMQIFAKNLSLIRGFGALGVGVMGLTHSWKTPFGDGAFERSDKGLTARGRMAVEALNEAGVVLDLSKTGRRTSMDAMAASMQPVVFSHSNPEAVHPHPMNLSNEQLDRCAATGGVVGVSASPHLVASSPSLNLKHVLRHLDYMVDRIGSKHVGLGLDFDDAARKRFASDPIPNGPSRYPEGLSGFEDMGRVRSVLESRGYADHEVCDIMGGNFLRVFNEVWGSG